jgi:hypothetical protein
MISFPLVFSLLSLAVSSYALYRGGPVGPKGDVGDTGARGPQGEKGETLIDNKPKFQKEIPDKPYDSDFETRLAEIRQRIQKGSGLMRSDPDAQSNQASWRRQNQR